MYCMQENSHSPNIFYIMHIKHTVNTNNNQENRLLYIENTCHGYRVMFIFILHAFRTEQYLGSGCCGN